MKKTNDKRREFLVSALSTGVYALCTMGVAQSVWGMAKIPHKLVSGKSIYDLSGEVSVDGKAATENTVISVNSNVRTGENSHVVFVVGTDAFILRSNSALIVEGDLILSQIKLISGKLLSVFGHRVKKQRLSINTATATIGIRGTGVYLEVDAKKTYICTCYGHTQLSAVNDKKSVEKVTAKHHDSPRYIYSDKPAGENIQLAPVINHTDDELVLLEALVGRDVPFVVDDY